MSQKQLRIAFFGHFDGSNFGNESTFQAMLDRLRSVMPGASFTCICTGPSATALTYHIHTIAIRDNVTTSKAASGRLAKVVRKLFIGAPKEVGRWIRGFRCLWGTDALIVPGTGLLSDAYGLLNWGPYDMFRWTVTAKMCRCKLLFVSMGAGPVYTRLGRFFVKTALSISDFRSYRDFSTQQYLKGIGLRADKDPVYPDLAFSLYGSDMQEKHLARGRKAVVGLGLMEYAGRYSVENPTAAVPSAYLKTLVEFVEWLLAQGYDIRLLSGDKVDGPVMEEFQGLLEQSDVYDADRIVHDPVRCAGHLMEQLAAVDIVVATRFHNILLSLLLNRPAIAISFHHKCSSLMKQTGLVEYCEDINSISKDRLIARFCRLRQNEGQVRRTIAEHVKACQDALDEQYSLILKVICPDRQQELQQSRVAQPKSRGSVVS